MGQIVSFLNSPLHVIRFQYLCGVPYTKEELAGHVSKKVSSIGNGPIAKNGKVRHRQQTCDTSDHTEEEEATQPVSGYFVFDLMFRFCSGLGGELFYITFLPFCCWNVDFWLIRRCIWLWVVTMYVGQAMKDIFKRPRPPKPVKRLETWFDNEYGFPSTHAIVAACIPYGLWYLALNRYQFPSDVAFVIASVWCALVCISRLYLGIHTILDILAGCFIAVSLLYTSSWLMDSFDEFVCTHPLSPIVVVLGAVFLMVVYPRKQHVWCPARGDTAKIVGVGIGVGVGAWYINDITTDPYIDTPFPVKIESMTIVVASILRFILGCLLLVLVREIFETISLKILSRILPNDPSVFWKHQVWLEIPVRLVTYSAVGFAVLFPAPIVFQFLGHHFGIDLTVTAF
ncbi:sphingosine-1-phosphate phosphatase 2-like [Corticium candelabrum]|uniref:sphingosine-1-phosphate phosphatase 2-like n=1 Tax=Corticium candelabrum TaxID=121492 RepID=UPI002E26C3EC|nr:sphingosine-1-phosphate phosphatase 2-like [Corticium candelabrum]